MPSTLRLASKTLVGRDGELRAMLAALRELPDGQPGVAVVSGRAGMGKTRFVTTVTERLRADGVRVLAGACLDLAAGAPPYTALIAAFRSVDPPAVEVLDALTGAVNMRRSRLFELLRSTMAALARRRPTVLVVEDLHLSDRVTRDALLYLTTMAREGRWALVVTFRESEAAARPGVSELREQLHRDALVQVSLDAFSPRQVAAQIAGISGTPPAPDDAARVHRRSGGIPLLVEEVVAAEAAGATGIPDHLRDLFRARVARLGPGAVRAVEVVAVAGDRCVERLVAAVTGADPRRVAAALDRAVGADVLAVDGAGYRMRHELLREAVYGALPPARRRSLHRGLAAALAGAPAPDVSALAHHWYAADEPARAALANLDAAGLAERVHAPGEVHTYLERVLEHAGALPAGRADAVGGRAGLLARAAEAAYLSGVFARAVAVAVRALDEVDDPSEIAVRWERLARYRWVSRDGAGAQHAHERSVAVLPDDAPATARARVLSGYGWYLAMTGWGMAADAGALRRDAARECSDRALAAADASGAPLERCRALLAWGLARGDEEAGLAALWEARDLAVGGDVPDELGRVHGALDLALRQQGRMAGREQVLRDGLRHAAAHGLGGIYTPSTSYLLAELLLELGRWDEAGQILAELVARGIIGVPAMFTHAYRAWLAAVRGQPETASACADRAMALSEDLPQQPVPPAVARCARAESCLWSGEVDQALTYAEEAVAVTRDTMWRAEAEGVRARAVADLAERARRDGRPVEARPAGVDSDAGGLAERHPRLRAFGTTVRAELSRRDGRRDPEPWRDAAASWDDAGDPYHAAYCRWRLAHALLATRAGRPEAARALDAAHRDAARLGARPLLEAVAGLAGAARIRLATAGATEGAAAAHAAGPVAVAERLGLTHRELEIVPHLVAGRTNAEIAQALVISPRTVGVHVSRILHKLGATRRTEAAELARRRGLVQS